MTLQVLRDDGHKNRSRLVEFEISSKQVQETEYKTAIRDEIRATRERV